jgi:hypothetical protein
VCSSDLERLPLFGLFGGEPLNLLTHLLDRVLLRAELLHVPLVQIRGAVELAHVLANAVLLLGDRRDLLLELLPLHRRLFVEANPIPVKWALSAMGLIENALRLPLVPLSPHHHETVRDALRVAGALA